MKKISFLILLTTLLIFQQKSYAMHNKRGQVINRVIKKFHPSKDVSELINRIKNHFNPFIPRKQTIEPIIEPTQTISNTTDCSNTNTAEKYPIFAWIKEGNFEALYNLMKEKPYVFYTLSEDNNEYIEDEESDNNPFVAVTKIICACSPFDIEIFNNYRKLLQRLMKLSFTYLDLLADAYEIVLEKIKEGDTSLLVIENEMLRYLIEFNLDNEESINEIIKITVERNYVSLTEYIIKEIDGYYLNEEIIKYVLKKSINSGYVKIIELIYETREEEFLRELSFLKNCLKLAKSMEETNFSKKRIISFFNFKLSQTASRRAK